MCGYVTSTLFIISSLCLLSAPASGLHIDAATWFRGRLYIFHGIRYVQFNKYSNGRFYQTGYGHFFAGMPGYLTSAFKWASAQHKTYFFQRASYYRYTVAYKKEGPFETKWNWNRFGTIANAAGSRQSKAYFFKGCSYVEFGRDSKKDVEPKNSSSVNLPCEPEAAFCSTDNQKGHLYVVKDDKYWIWKVGESRARDPEPLSKLLQVKWKDFGTPIY